MHSFMSDNPSHQTKGFREVPKGLNRGPFYAHPHTDRYLGVLCQKVNLDVLANYCHKTQ